MSDRLGDTDRFYGLLDRLADRVGGPRHLQNCRAGMCWPLRGVYFFFENGETRLGTGAGLRVVRIGTHGLKNGAQSTLWGRLRQHRGSPRSGLGNHRGSIFRCSWVLPWPDGPISRYQRRGALLEVPEKLHGGFVLKGMQSLNPRLISRLL